MKYYFYIVLIIIFSTILTSTCFASSVGDIGLRWVAMMGLDHYYHFTAGTQVNVLMPSMTNLNNTLAGNGMPRIDKMYGLSYTSMPIWTFSQEWLLEGDLNWLYGASSQKGAINQQAEIAVFNPSLSYLYTKTFQEDISSGSFGIFAGVDWAALTTRILTAGVVNERNMKSFAPSYGVVARFEYGSKLDMTLNLQARYRFCQLPDFNDEFGNTIANTSTDLNGLQIGFGIRSWF